MNKIIGGIIVTVVAGLILTLTGWNFAETAGAPKKFASKKDNREDHDKMNDKIEKNRDRMDEHQQKILDEIKEIQRLIIELHKK